MNIWGVILWSLVIIGAIGTVISLFCCMERAFNFEVIAGGAGLSMVFFSEFAKHIKILIIIAFVCMVACLLLIWCRPIRRNKRRVVRTRIKKSLIGFGNIFAIAMGIYIIFSLPFTMKITNVTEQNDQVTTETASEEAEAVYGEEYGFSANAETMINLLPERWKKLSLEEKKEVAQCVALCEARYFGLWTPLHVEAKEFLEEGVLGCYVENTHTIYINEEHLKKGEAEDVLKTILHESYHAYSHRLVDLYEASDEKMKNLLTFYETRQYAEEFENYVDGSENMVEYITQQCESDARKYANQAIDEYYSMIDLYLKEKKE